MPPRTSNGSFTPATGSSRSSFRKAEPFVVLTFNGRLTVDPEGEETNDNDEVRGKGTGRGGRGPGVRFVVRRGRGELLFVRGVGDGALGRRSCHIV